jgi:hypothetical protein
MAKDDSYLLADGAVQYSVSQALVGIEGSWLVRVERKVRGCSFANDESKRACQKERCRRLSDLYRWEVLELAGKRKQ